MHHQLPRLLRHGARLWSAAFVVSLGISAAANGAVVFEDGFESGALVAPWTVSTTNNGRVATTSDFAPASGSKHLLIDDSANDATYSLGEATLSLNLSGKKNVVLKFKAKSVGNEPHSPPSGTFSSTRNYDGVAISTNGGNTWRTVQSLAGVAGTWQSFSIPLQQTVISLGGSYGPNFRIRFSAYDNSPAPLDGIAIDDVAITADDDLRSILELPSPLIEGTGTQTGHVVLTSPQPNDVVLQLIASPSGQLAVPASVTVLAGQSSAAFEFSVIDDTAVNLTRDISVTASASGVTAQPATIRIFDDEAPTVTLAVPSQRSEGAYASTDNATATLSHAATAPVTLSLTADPDDQLSFPSTTVTIPAGQTQAGFKVDAADDAAIDGNVVATVNASAPGIQSATAQTTAVDNEPRALGLSLPATVQEDREGSGTVTIPGSLAGPLVVHLTSSDPARASVPATVTIPAGETSNNFTITPTDNAARDGSRSVTITAQAESFTGASGIVAIRDNEVAAYRVGIGLDIVDIAGPVPFTVSATDIEGNVILGASGTVNVSIVEANGSAQPASPPTLTLTGTETAGAVSITSNVSPPVRIRVADQDGHTGESRPVDFQRVLSLMTADLVWDGSRQRLYASVPSNAPAYANQVVAIDPVTLQVTGNVLVGQNPGQLALTSGGEALYVALNANGSVARINPETMSVVSTFSLGSSSSQGPLFAKDLCTVVGEPNAVVVLRGQAGSSSSTALAVYDNGVARSATVSAYAVEPSSDPGIVFGQPDYNGNLSRVQVTANGLTTLGVSPTGYISAGTMVADRNTVVSASGYELDGATLRVAGRFPLASTSVSQLPRPDIGSNRVFFLQPKTGDYGSSYNAIAAYDPASLALIRRVIMPEVASAGSFIRWGANGLAFRTSSTVVLLSAGQLVPSEAPADLSVSIEASPSSVPAGASISYALTLTNYGPNTARNASLVATLSEGQALASVTASAGSVSTDGNVVRLMAGDVPSGATITLTIGTTASGSPGSVSCNALASSNSVDGDFQNNVDFELVPVAYQSGADAANQIALSANNLLYDASRNRIWATVPKSAGPPLGASLIAIDPLTGTISEPIVLGGDPRYNCIALSANARYLYIGLSDAPAVVRVDLASPGYPRLRVPLAVTPTASFFAHDLEVLDGDGTSFIVSATSNSGVFVFDGTVRRPTSVDYYGPDRLERTSTPNVFLAVTLGSSSRLARLTVTASGVSITKSTYDVISFGYAQGGEVRTAGDLMLASSGQLAETNNLTLQGNFGSSGAPCLDGANGRGYLATGTTLRAFEVSTGTAIATFGLPGPVAEFTYANAPTLIRWGTDGFAVTGPGKVYLARWSVANAPGGDADGDNVSDAWEIAYFGTTNVDLAADSDRDGLPNVFEYFYGTSPVESGGNPMQVGIEEVGAGEAVIHLIYPRRAGIPPAAYGYEVSPSLNQWMAASGVTETVLGSETVNGVQIQMIDTAIPAPNAIRSFARVKWVAP